jgi:hypothetical protein
MLPLDLCLTRFTANADALAALVRSASDEQARWKPSPTEWSILEVICHLYDEEREDFRARTRSLLETPLADFTPIDPGNWVTARGYNQRDPATVLDAFLHERQASLAWLKSLSHPDWSSTHTHPVFGSVTAGEMLNAWVAHDHLHLRQLNHLHWQYLALSVEPGALEYAGGW